MRILVFGASGWVGSRLTDHLAGDHEIIGVVRKPPAESGPPAESRPPADIGPPAASGSFTPLVCPDWVAKPETVVERFGDPAVVRALGAADGHHAESGAAGQDPVGLTAAGTDPAGIDAVLAAVGGWYVGPPLLERGLSAFDADYESHLRAHMSACTIASALGVDVHLALNGVASIEACVGSGAISVFGAAQQMLIRVADAESAHTRFRELTILAPLAGDERNDLDGGVSTIGIGAVSQAVMTILNDPDSTEITTYASPPG